MHILSLKWSTYLGRTIGVLICNFDYVILFFMPLDLGGNNSYNLQVSVIGLYGKIKTEPIKGTCILFHYQYIDLETHSQTLYFERGKEERKVEENQSKNMYMLLYMCIETN